MRQQVSLVNIRNSEFTHSLRNLKMLYQAQRFFSVERQDHYGRSVGKNVEQAVTHFKTTLSPLSGMNEKNLGNLEPR
jgi:hypothetical protein